MTGKDISTFERIEDWKKLYDPKPGSTASSKWKEYRSASCLARSWYSAKGDFPKKVRQVLSSFSDIAIVKACAEHPISLKGKGGSSMNDLFVFAKTSDIPIAIAVEGKAGESFGNYTVKKWRVRGSGKTNPENRSSRLKHLLNMINLTEEPAIETVYYQLLHRMASSVRGAEMDGAKYAIMIIQAFSKTSSVGSKNFKAFSDFVKLYPKAQQIEVKPDQLITLGEVHGIVMMTAWVDDDSCFERCED